MSKVNSKPSKPKKPYPTFPLTAMGNGYWCRKINGKIYYFGRWEDPDGALKKHNEEYHYLKSGVAPPTHSDAWTVKALFDKYLTAQQKRVDNGEIASRTFESDLSDARIAADHLPKLKLVAALNPDDFQKLRDYLVGKYAPSAANTKITRIKSIFKYAFDMRFIEKPVFYGASFKAVPKRVLRKYKNAKPKPLFTPSQVNILLNSAAVESGLRAMIWLAFNCGLNNSDFKGLEFRHIDLKSGWLDYARQKTGIQRRAKLLPETVSAIREYLKHRVRPKIQFEQTVFITNKQNHWAHSSLSSSFRDLIERINADDPTKPIPHGTLRYFRHGLETFGSTEKVVCDTVMGHVTTGIGAEYRELIPDSKLEEVADNLRDWLNGGVQ